VVSGGVQFYLLEVFAAGADPRVAAPIASQNLGLPPAINGVCTADVKTTIASLAPGSYLATVSSLSTPEGKLRSAPFAFTR